MKLVSDTIGGAEIAILLKEVVSDNGAVNTSDLPVSPGISPHGPSFTLRIHLYVKGVFPPWGWLPLMVGGITSEQMVLSPVIELNRKPRNCKFNPPTSKGGDPVPAPMLLLEPSYFPGSLLD